MVKLISQLQSQSTSLWARVIRGKYGSSGILRFPTTSSAFWKGIGRVWHEANFHIKWHPGDGTRTKFWEDFWVGDNGPLKLLSYAPIDSLSLPPTVKDYMNEDLTWRVDLFKDLLPPNLVEAIIATQLHPPDTPPTCYWHLNLNGRFSTRSAYKYFESANWDDTDRQWLTLWKLPMPQRVKTFAWLLLKGKLLTNAERLRRKISTSDQCSLCANGTEDLDHALKLCPLASRVWKEILPPATFHDFMSTSLRNWMQALLIHPRCHVSWTIGCFIACWKLWESRNLQLFTDMHPTVHSVASLIRSAIATSLSSFFPLSSLL